MEYLDDEDDFENGIYCYHIYHVDNLNWTREPTEIERVLMAPGELFHRIIESKNE